MFPSQIFNYDLNFGPCIYIYIRFEKYLRSRTGYLSFDVNESKHQQSVRKKNVSILSFNINLLTCYSFVR